MNLQMVVYDRNSPYRAFQDAGCYRSYTRREYYDRVREDLVDKEVDFIMKVVGIAGRIFAYIETTPCLRYPIMLGGAITFVWVTYLSLPTIACIVTIATSIFIAYTLWNIASDVRHIREILTTRYH